MASKRNQPKSIRADSSTGGQQEALHLLNTLEYFASTLFSSIRNFIRCKTAVNALLERLACLCFLQRLQGAKSI